MRADHYDSFAQSYSRSNESGLFNAYYARPAMIALAGDVHGRRVLDAGCGSGPLAEALRAKGAIVTGFDSSPAMVELARQRLGEDADLQVADLSRPLPYADGAFDDVVVSLVLHYLQDWTAPLAELRRVLKPGGRLLLSVNHPRILESSDPGADYFSVTQYSDEYTFDDGQTRGADLLAPALARHDRRVHRGRLPHRGHQRASLLARHPTRAPPARPRRPNRLHLLHLLRPGGTLTSEARSRPRTGGRPSATTSTPAAAPDTSGFAAIRSHHQADERVGDRGSPIAGVGGAP